MHEIVSRFIDKMREHGFEPARHSDILPTGEDEYFDIAGDKKKKRGGYCLTIEADGFAHGNFINFRTGEKGKWHSKMSDAGMTDAQRKEIDERVKRAEAEREKKKRAEELQAAEVAESLISSSREADFHDYLINKKIMVYGIRQDDESLIIPMRDFNRLWSVQRIYEDGNKQYLKHGKKKGTFYKIQGDDKAVLLCEGVATGHSLFEATGYTVYVCFDSGNLIEVARAIRANGYEGQIIVCADNDSATIVNGKPHNTGIIKGKQAAAAVKGFCVWPDQDEYDFNDVSVNIGLDAVREKIESIVIKTVKQEIIEISPPTDIYETEYHAMPIEYDAKSSDKSPVWDEDKIRSRMVWKKEPRGMDVLGQPEANSMKNIMLYMRHHELFSEIFRYDKFAGQVVVSRCPFWQHDKENFKVRRVHDTDLTYIVEWLETRRIKSSKEKVSDAIDVIARENWINPPLEYFKSLEWDGVDRLSKWLTYYLGAEEQHPDYLAAIGTKWLVSGVARIFNAGCKVDTMLVLEGEQGLMKSTALSVLATVGKGDLQESYFCDTLTFGEIKDKDSLMKLQGKLIVEFPELAKLGDRQVEEVKQWMANTVDECRRPYARLVEQFPRQFILAGTTNESAYLKDSTGNRRFWPVRCGRHIDIPALKRDREQLWAQAVHLYKSGYKWWLERGEGALKIAMEEQKHRMVTDAWEYDVKEIVREKSHVTIPDVLRSMGLKLENRDYRATARVSAILSGLGWQNTSRYDRLTKKNVRAWYPPENIIDVDDNTAA